MSYDPATVRAVCEFLRSHTTWEGKPDVIGAAYAEVIEERFPTESPAPEPSTDTLREALERIVALVVATDEGLSLVDALDKVEAEARAALAATPAREDDERCEHDWVDIRNRVIKSGEMCSRCGALRPAPWHLRESSEHCTTCGGPCLLPGDKG